MLTRLIDTGVLSFLQEEIVWDTSGTYKQKLLGFFFK